MVVVVVTVYWSSPVMKVSLGLELQLSWKPPEPPESPHAQRAERQTRALNTHSCALTDVRARALREATCAGQLWASAGNTPQMVEDRDPGRRMAAANEGRKRRRSRLEQRRRHGDLHLFVPNLEDQIFKKIF